jgi:hypothetical protein
VIIRKIIGETKLVVSGQLGVKFCTGGCEERSSACETKEYTLLKAVVKGMADEDTTALKND